MGSRFISLKPRFNNPKDVPPGAIDALESGMANDHRAGMKSKTTSNSANRVEKWKASTKKWKSHNGSILEERFNGKLPTWLE